MDSEEQRSGGGSLFNLGEAKVCASALRALADEHLGGLSAGAVALRSRVAVLTPYRRQVGNSLNLCYWWDPMGRFRCTPSYLASLDLIMIPCGAGPGNITEPGD